VLPCVGWWYLVLVDPGHQVGQNMAELQPRSKSLSLIMVRIEWRTAFVLRSFMTSTLRAASRSGTAVGYVTRGHLG
jgi:hypothetical protein